MKRMILKYAMKYLASRRGRDYGEGPEVIQNGRTPLSSAVRPNKNTAAFGIAAILILLALLIGGTTELISSSNLGKHISNTWHSVLNSSPQKVIEQTNNLQQTTVSDGVNQVTSNLQQKTIGDGLNSVSSSIGSVVKVILSPLDALLGIIILLVAVGIRSKRFIGNTVARFRSQRTISQSLSWVVLTFSLVPSLIDYFVL